MGDSLTQSFNEGDLNDPNRRKGPVTRICEYCEVKIDNPQVEKLYEFGKVQRKIENHIVDQKIEWYDDSIGGIDK